MRTPSASSTSAEPDRPVAERLPCLATAQPAPAAISAAVVETLNVGRPPPVPAVSTGRRGAGRAPAWRTRASCGARPTISVDRLPLRAQRDQHARGLDLGGVAGHDLGQHRRGLLRGEVLARRQRVDRLREDGVRQGSSRSSCLPSGVSTDSGWNWTPCAGSSRWRIAISTPPPCAVASSSSGRSASHDERVVAADRQRIGQPGEEAVAVVRRSRSSCRAPGTWRTTVPPNACASDWWPRQTPSVGTPASGKRRITSTRDARLVRACTGRARRRRGRSRARAARRPSRRRCARPRAPPPARPGTGRGCR